MKYVLAIIGSIFLGVSCVCLAQTPGTNDPQALTLIAKSIAAMTGGKPVLGVTLTANAISILGSDYFTGTATLQANGTDNSRVDLKLSGASRTEVRTASGGEPSGSWASASSSSRAYPSYNCWTDAAWFFPALSSLSRAGATGFFVKYVGPEQKQGLRVQHIRVFQHLANDPGNRSFVDQLSAMDFYLDATSLMPLVVAFKLHSDTDMNLDIPMEVRFANYQMINGVLVPFHIQRLLNGSLWLDLTVTSAVLSSSSISPSTIQ